MATDLTAVLDLPVAPAFRAQTVRERRLIRVIQPVSGTTLTAAVNAAREAAVAALSDRVVMGAIMTAFLANSPELPANDADIPAGGGWFRNGGSFIYISPK